MFLSEALTAPDEGAFRILAAADPGVLMEVRRPDVPLAIWQRPPPEPGILWPLLRLAPFRAVVEDLAEDCALRLAAGLPAPLPPALLRDIRWLCVSFSVILGRKRLRARLEGITGDACRRFHADYVSVRLICTYAGTGTQWLDGRSAALLRDGVAPGEAAIRHLGTGDVGLFKGREWAGDRAIIHRSPPIAGTGERRLLLVIDPAPDVCR